jgi:hypothetical protein
MSLEAVIYVIYVVGIVLHTIITIFMVWEAACGLIGRG